MGLAGGCASHVGGVLRCLWEQVCAYLRCFRDMPRKMRSARSRFHAYLRCSGTIRSLFQASQIEFGRRLQKLRAANRCVFTAFVPLFGMFLRVAQNVPRRFCAYVSRLRRFRAEQKPKNTKWGVLGPPGGLLGPPGSLGWGRRRDAAGTPPGRRRDAAGRR